jgi:hypothetical protein
VPRYEHRAHSITAAPPGWWLYLGYTVRPATDGEVEGVVERRALAGWVVVDQYEYEHADWNDDSGDRGKRTGSRQIEPGWFSEGIIVTHSTDLDDYPHEELVIGPGEEEPSEEDLAEWRDRLVGYRKAWQASRARRAAKAATP